MNRLSVPGSELALEFDETNEKSFDPCECCGEPTRRIWGYAYRGESATAAYFVEWNPRHADSATFDLIVGPWGEQADTQSRSAISLEFRKLDSGPAFRIGNASDRAVGKSSLVGQAMDRNDVLGTTLAIEAFSICDAVYMADPRIVNLR